jgi:hypothetical protein
MKKHLSTFTYIAAVAATIALSVATADGQTVTRDAAGNYTAAPKAETAKRDSVTGLTYTDAAGVQWPVYVGAKGSHYVCRVSKKSGKFYRQYLKSEE